MSKNTRALLDKIQGNIGESMGVREPGLRPKLSPVPNRKDQGRRPLRNIGEIEVERVVPDPNQPRQHFSEEGITELSENIKKYGMMHPILVQWSEEHGKWVIVAGERRWRATSLAGLPTIKCTFQEGELQPSEILEQQLVENCLREDLNPIERARGFADLMELNSWTGKEVAEALRIRPSTVSRALSLLKLPADIQQQVISGEIAARSAAEFSRVPDEAKVRTLAAKAAGGRITHQDAIEEARRAAPKPRKERTTRKTYNAPHEIKVTVSSPRILTDDEVEAAIEFALKEQRRAASASTS